MTQGVGGTQRPTRPTASTTMYMLYICVVQHILDDVNQQGWACRGSCTIRPIHPYTIYSVLKHPNKNRTLFAVTASHRPIVIFLCILFYLVVVGHAVTVQNGGYGKFCPVFFSPVVNTTNTPKIPKSLSNYLQSDIMPI